MDICSGGGVVSGNFQGEVRRVHQAKTTNVWPCAWRDLQRNGGVNKLCKRKTTAALELHICMLISATLSLPIPFLRAFQKSLHGGPRLAIASRLIWKVWAHQGGATGSWEGEGSTFPQGGNIWRGMLDPGKMASVASVKGTQHRDLDAYPSKPSPHS